MLNETQKKNWEDSERLAVEAVRKAAEQGQTEKKAEEKKAAAQTAQPQT